MPAHDRTNPAAVHGFLNLYKPSGITSMDALRRVKRSTGVRRKSGKIGHAGTLDPLAQGVLPICFGQATRLMEQVVAGRKRYQMTVCLGAVSPTYDAEGDITPVADPAGIDPETVRRALKPFIGVIQQTPPMYSALKVDGKRLYDLARAGREVARQPRPVEIHAITVNALDLPLLSLTVDCGKGTYLRSLAHDLGQSLGCGGYVTELTRTHVGRFNASDGITPDALESAGADWPQLIYPIDWALRELPSLSLDATQARAIRNGQPITAGDVVDSRSFAAANGIDGRPSAAHEQRRAYDDNDAFLALVELQPELRHWQPIRVFNCPEPSPYAGQMSPNAAPNVA